MCLSYKEKNIEEVEYRFHDNWVLFEASLGHKIFLHLLFADTYLNIWQIPILIIFFINYKILKSFKDLTF